MLRLEARPRRSRTSRNDRFHEILPGPCSTSRSGSKRVVFCSGKIYYDLLKFRDENQISTSAVVRIEQLTARRRADQTTLASFPNAKAFVCAGESQNMGAWASSAGSFAGCSTPTSGTPAGPPARARRSVRSVLHKKEQRLLI